MTYREMCTLVSEWMREVKKVYLSPIEVFNYSPSGELYMIHVWYEEAKAWKDSLTSERG